MSRGIATTEICGVPLKFYNLDRPRTDYAPVCHRPPHEGPRHMSAAAVEHARQYLRDRRHQVLILEKVLAA
jgi:hypothetical protein